MAVDFDVVVKGDGGQGRRGWSLLIQECMALAISDQGVGYGSGNYDLGESGRGRRWKGSCVSSELRDTGYGTSGSWGSGGLGGGGFVGCVSVPGSIEIRFERD